MDAATRRLVRHRAEECCEYCGSRQQDEPFFRFQVEHIIAKQHGGGDEADNLALACPHCNLHKGPNLTGIDPTTGAITVLFNPRTQVWAEHFSQQGPVFVGLTSTGRTTVRVLSMNDPLRVELRATLLRRLSGGGEATPPP
jgi:hypothetical protein